MSVHSSDSSPVPVQSPEEAQPRAPWNVLFPQVPHAENRTQPHPWLAYAGTVITIVVCTLICQLIRSFFSPVNLVMIYLAGVVFVATRYGRGPSILASILSVAAFDFFFTTPYLTMVVDDTEYLLTFFVMLLVAFTISGLTVHVRQQAETALERERRTASLYAISREFASHRGTDNLVQVATQQIGDLFSCQAVVLLPDRGGHFLIQPPIDLEEALFDSEEQGVAEWVYEHRQSAGLTTGTLPGAQGLYVPLLTARESIGVLGVYPGEKTRAFSPDQLDLLQTFANLTAVALERARLAEETERARIQIEMERQRNTLLSSISHDLRTPLASITGAVSSLLDSDERMDASQRRELAQLAYEEAGRLNRQISNLLDITRLESGTVKVEKEWQSLEEMIGTTLNRLGDTLDQHPLAIRLPDDLPLVPCDSLLIEQVLVNLLENAARYTPPGTPLEISAISSSDQVTIEVADQGPGLAPGEETRIFEKFYRANPGSAPGVGLGLTICRSVVEAHGGQIWAENRAGGGAVFRFTLPVEGLPPEVKREDEQLF